MTGDMMPAPRTFDRELLKELLRLHPDWSRHQIAKALTEDNLSKGIDKTVNPTTVSKAIYDMKIELEAEGIEAQRPVDECLMIRQLKENTGRQVAPEGQQGSLLVQLRQADRLRRGLPVNPPRRAVWTANWESKLRENRHVIDLDEHGMPFERAALPHETQDGQLIDIIAQPAMSPREADLQARAEEAKELARRALAIAEERSRALAELSERVKVLEQGDRSKQSARHSSTA